MNSNGFKYKYFFRFISPLNGSENNTSMNENSFTSPSGEEKQKEILDSIRYAKRIQHSLLPNEKYISKSLDKLNKTGS